MGATKILGQLAGDAAGGVFGGLGKLVGNIRAAFTGKEALTSEDRGKIETALVALESGLLELQGKVVQAQQSIIVAEAQGGSWLQRNWRPMVMLMFAFIIFNNYILYPYCQAIFDWGVKLETPPELWGLMRLGLGGYVVGRSVEKSVKYYRSKDSG
jgi:hypothetical protein